jgi:selenide, water dikinase
VLRSLTPVVHPNLIVGTETGDDAAVWRIDRDRALVATADFITPIVDDARAWGKIAAANSVSDVYAMGGTPLFALNLVSWNSAELPTALMGDVLAGAAEISTECGYVTIGGHTVEDPEPKFGLVVIGQARPGLILSNAGLRDGDALVLTKRLGTGIVATAIKQGTAPGPVAAAAIGSMTSTNAAASAAALGAGATGGTDITGFGLLGHLGQMAAASNVDVRLDCGAIALLPGVTELAEKQIIPGGTKRNLDWVRDQLDATGVSELTLLILADAQTSGGLLFGAAPGRAAGVAAELNAAGVPAAVIGSAHHGTGRIVLR